MKIALEYANARKRTHAGSTTLVPSSRLQMRMSHASAASLTAMYASRARGSGRLANGVKSASEYGG